MTTIKPNDTGINLGDAGLPAAADAFDNAGAVQEQQAPAQTQTAPEPEQQPEQPTHEQIKQQIIAREDRRQRQEMIMAIN